MPVFSPEKMRKLGAEIFKAVGVSDEDADRVITSLVLSNLVGHDSHGVIRIPSYVNMVQKGKIKPNAKIDVIKETPVTAILDGNWGFGQVIGKIGMDLAIQKAQKNYVGMVCLTQCNHLGRIGEYVMMAAEKNLIGMTVCNSGPPEGIVVPFGGRKPVLSTNPMAFAVPAGTMNPFLLDFATSQRAEGKIRVAYQKGERVPNGWIVDEEGKPTNDPNDFYVEVGKEIRFKGAILPFGEHKGYGLSMLVDILGGALSGAGITSLPEYQGGNGSFMLALNIEVFRPLDEFLDTMDRFIKRVKEVPPAPGFDEVIIPGEPEFKTKEKREKEGITISKKTWEDIQSLSKELGIDIQRFL